MPLHKVTCVPRGHALGIVRRHFSNSRVYGTHVVPPSDLSVARRRHVFRFPKRVQGND